MGDYKIGAKEYRRQYYQKNKKELKKNNRKYYLKNREKILKRCKEYQVNNKDKRKQWREKNKEYLHQWNKEYYKKNRKRIRLYGNEYNKQYYQKCREEWFQIIKEHYGEIKCRKCRYDKCFQALDFHHDDPINKEMTLHQIMRERANPKMIEILKKELKKGHFLCATCHREFHYLYSHSN